MYRMWNVSDVVAFFVISGLPIIFTKQEKAEYYWKGDLICCWKSVDAF